MVHDVFISYAFEDREYADAVCAGLEQRGLSCWIAPRNIEPGSDWASVISEAIHHSRSLVLILSENSNTSSHIAREVSLADKYQVPLFCFRKEDIQPSRILEYYLVNIQWLDCFSIPDALVLDQLFVIVSKPKAPPTQSEISNLLQAQMPIRAEEPGSTTNLPAVDAPSPTDKPLTVAKSRRKTRLLPADPQQPTPSSAAPPENNPPVIAPSSSAYEIHRGDDLAAAVASAPSGATLQLHAGVYQLKAPLQLTKSISILSADEAHPQIVCSAAGAVVIFSGTHLTLTGLDFIHRGKKEANAVQISGKQISIENCTFSGGYTKRTAKDTIGNGLWVRGQTRGRISNCTFSANSRNGLLVSASAALILENNGFAENGETGLTFLNSSSGQATGNQCRKNGTDGIAVTGSATPILKDNICEGNARFGISFSTQSAVNASFNQCCQNSYSGILVTSFAAPDLENNVCEGNEGSGIIYLDNAAGQATGNQCKKNKLDGIDVRGSASPVLKNNICQSNLGYGIRFQRGSHPKLENNDLKDNHSGDLKKPGLFG